jgi:uncharacterized protein YbcI
MAKYTKGVTMILKAIFLFFSLFGVLSATEYFYYNGDKKVTLIKTTQSNETINYYTTPANTIIGVTDEIMIKLKDSTMLESLSIKYNFLVIDTLTENIYLIKVSNKEETLPMANELYLEDSVQYASPNFIKSIDKR